MSGLAFSRRRLAAAVALPLAVAACASQASPPPAAAQPRTVVTRDLITRAPRTVRAQLSDFSIPPWSSAGGECKAAGESPFGGRLEDVYYPSLAHAQILISLTVDTSGHVRRANEMHGVISFKRPPGDTTAAALQRAQEAAMGATRSTSISMDFATGRATLLLHGGNEPDRLLTTTMAAVAGLERLDRPLDHIREAAAHCGFGV
jgi:hypothetical protein